MKERENPSTSVERAVAMLDAIGARSTGMTNAEISRTLKIPKSSASYILRALEKSGYLRRDEAKYRLGLKLLSLRHSALDGLNVREVALPHVRALAERLKQSTHLAILDNGEAVYVEKADASTFIKMDTWIGRRIDIHSTSVGKALAAYLPKRRSAPSSNAAHYAGTPNSPSLPPLGSSPNSRKSVATDTHSTMKRTLLDCAVSPRPSSVPTDASRQALASAESSPRSPRTTCHASPRRSCRPPPASLVGWVMSPARVPRPPSSHHPSAHRYVAAQVLVLCDSLDRFAYIVGIYMAAYLCPP